jgi:DNA-binding CsgD family transcriptional regulator
MHTQNAELFDRAADLASIQSSAQALLKESLALYLKLHTNSETAPIPTPDSPGICAQCGRAPALEQAVVTALDLLDTLAMPEPSSPLTAELTPREAEVLRLLAAGKSNREIAAELVLSIRTAERHIANIYEKLGAHGKTARAAATAFAFSHGLIPHQTNGHTHTIRIAKYEKDG